eukprot:CAMPEP_0197726936 /NCGR_PEP_ID=MMETSP1434-20131217/17766_1 /TAXON_ID=265543 /ORGANISM="Minutocellus polymorphus, Strain CCMP3303" /LENGTH=128 /DNA_ID=CAMNT_0043312993 /DNA_START=103 /DNA_END=489 /DNA_ORIENTATION=-
MQSQKPESKNNASSSSTASSSAFADTSASIIVVEKDVKDDPSPLRRHGRNSDPAADDNTDQQEKDIDWGIDRTDEEANALSHRPKAQKNRRRFKFASLTGRSRPSYAMRLAKMASSKFSLTEETGTDE